ncbi:MAG: primosomal protein N' [Burkholderiaceae bacterium]|nr:primosomal protein N' [Burkholderiaceae bacterium]
MILRVALDTPLRSLFDYRAPPPANGIAGPGCRVRVPFGRRSTVGMVVETADHSDIDPAKLRSALELIDPAPVLDATLLALLRWCADYYHHPIGEVLAAALPKLAREGAPPVALSEYWHLTVEGAAARAADELRRARKQRALLELLQQSGGSASADTIAAHWPQWRGAARALVARGWIASSERPQESVPAAVPGTAQAAAATSLPPRLTAEQAEAVAALAAAAGRFQTVLLHGITGSGKTEVYLHGVADALARQQRALVLVPEIGLTPQLVGRFVRRFDVPVAVLHSGLTDTQRLAAWRDVLSGRARIVLGTRSAVFAPVADLGLVIVDEEHDSSFKQQEGGFRYSARDVAVMRAQMAGVPVMLGSATPSLETLQNVALGRYLRVALPRRNDQAPPPLLRLVDLRQESVHAGLSSTALAAIEKHLADDGQVLVYLNRRGYAPTLLCTACGWIAPCQNCDARYTVHRSAEKLQCHHCGAERPLPRQCPQCGYAVKPVGQGTERVEEALAETFPQAPIARLDRDVVRSAAELEAVVDQVASGSARILVGTQMVTKGHDFPNVTLVVVLNADQGLFSTDFRAAERLAQTIVQVAGRAGRAQRPGEVLIQTEYPEHPLLAQLLESGYDGFAAAALAERRASGWPPFARLAALRASATEVAPTMDFLRAARAAGQGGSARGAAPPGLRLLGPAPAAMARRAGRHHAQLLLESADRGALQRFLAQWIPQVDALPEARRVRWDLDVDPLDLF